MQRIARFFSPLFFQANVSLVVFILHSTLKTRWRLLAYAETHTTEKNK